MTDSEPPVDTVAATTDNAKPKDELGPQRIEVLNAEERKEKKTPPESEEEAPKDGKKHPLTVANTGPARPIKKARTAYFIFADEKRAELQAANPGGGVAALARATGQLWSALNPEEKAVYQTQAAAERERVAKEIEELRESGQYPEVDTTSNDSNNPNSLHLTFPVARIRKICKLDPEVKNLSKEASLMVTKLAELFNEKLGHECVKVAQMQNRRKLLPEDVAQVCSSREQFLFLREDVQDLVRAENEKKSERKASSATQPAPPPSGTRTLTSYFAPSNSVAAGVAGGTGHS